MSKKSNTIGLTAVLTLGFALVGILAVQPDARAATETMDWTNSDGDNDYTNANNWNPSGDVPDGADDDGNPEIGFINKAGTDRAEVKGAISTKQLPSQVFIGANSAGDASGEVYLEGTSDQSVSFGSNTSTGYIGGGVDPSDSSTLGGTGTLTMGDYSRAWYTHEWVIGYGPNGDGTLKANGVGDTAAGSTHIDTNLIIGETDGTGYGTGLVELEEGGVVVKDGDLVLNKGTFRQIGTLSESKYGTQIGYGGDVGNWIQGTQGETATLEALIDDSVAGFRPIDVDKGDTGGPTFGADAVLDLGFADGVTPYEGNWTIMEWGGSVSQNDLSLALEDVGTGWSYTVDETDKALRVEYVPEPGSLAMLLIGAAALLGTRRRRRC